MPAPRKRAVLAKALQGVGGAFKRAVTPPPSPNSAVLVALSAEVDSAVDALQARQEAQDATFEPEAGAWSAFKSV